MLNGNGKSKVQRKSLSLKKYKVKVGTQETAKDCETCAGGIQQRRLHNDITKGPVFQYQTCMSLINIHARPLNVFTDVYYTVVGWLGRNNYQTQGTLEDLTKSVIQRCY